MGAAARNLPLLLAAASGRRAERRGVGHRLPRLRRGQVRHGSDLPAQRRIRRPALIRAILDNAPQVTTGRTSATDAALPQRRSMASSSRYRPLRPLGGLLAMLQFTAARPRTA